MRLSAERFNERIEELNQQHSEQVIKLKRLIEDAFHAGYVCGIRDTDVIGADARFKQFAYENGIENE